MRHILTVLALLISTMAVAGAIKTWSNSEVLKASDLNAALAHVHSAAEASITDSKVASTAAIAHSKLATPALVPKAWAYVASCNCGSAIDTVTCTLNASSGVTSVKSGGSNGYCRITLSYTPTNANYAVLCTSSGANTSICGVLSAPSTTAPHIGVKLLDYAGAGMANPTDGFFFAVFDDNS